MALAVIFLIVFMGFSLASIIRKSVDASNARKLAESQAAALAIKQDDLSKKIAELNTEDGQEAALREQFPVVKPGEHVVVITDPNTDATSDVPVEQDTTQQGGFWNFLKGLFEKK